MHAHSLFAPTSSQLFHDEIDKYCKQNNIGLVLNENELDQLFLYMTSQHASPELRDAKISDPLHFEIKRSLARCWAFELLLQGDEAAHNKFVISQAQDVRLSWNDFSQLAQEAKSLTDETRQVIRASCFLTINEKLKTSLAEFNLSKDSEEFLTQLSELLVKQNIKHLIPLLRSFDEDSLQLLRKIYWPKMHLRAMIQTEGFDNITANFTAGILAGEFTQTDFTAWKWRWITASCGFRLGGGAIYYDTNIHFLTTMVLHSLARNFQVPDKSYLEEYLLDRARLAGISKPKFQYEEIEYQLLGHMAAFSNQVHIVTLEKGALIMQAYNDYCTDSKDESSLAQNYCISRKTKTIAPTYATSVYSNFYDISYKEQIKAGFNPRVAATSALYQSTLFMFYLFADLYRLTLDNRISLERLSKTDYLATVFPAWQEDNNCVSFTLNEQLELIAAIKTVPSITHRMN